MTIGGAAEIEALYRNATGGVFQMPADTAEKCAEKVQTLISELTRQRARTELGHQRLASPFESARQMHDGFSDKLIRLGSVLDQYIEAAEQLRASFLIAGKLLSEEDAEAAAAIRRASSEDAVGR